MVARKCSGFELLSMRIMPSALCTLASTEPSDTRCSRNGVSIFRRLRLPTSSTSGPTGSSERTDKIRFCRKSSEHS